LLFLDLFRFFILFFGHFGDDDPHDCHWVYLGSSEKNVPHGKLPQVPKIDKPRPLARLTAVWGAHYG